MVRDEEHMENEDVPFSVANRAQCLLLVNRLNASLPWHKRALVKFWPNGNVKEVRIVSSKRANAVWVGGIFVAFGLIGLTVAGVVLLIKRVLESFSQLVHYCVALLGSHAVRDIVGSATMKRCRTT
jgi:hypothetical protein